MDPVKKDERKKRARALIRVLEKEFPNSKLVLKYGSNWELLVAVQLSAQCTDKKVNEVTRALFKKYKGIESYANADVREFQKDIFQTGFYKNKSRNIQAAAKMILENHKGRVPKTMDELLKIPGVARKTANVVLGNAFGVVEGITVDTHMIRFSRRFDLTDYKDAVKIERDLMEVIPKSKWFDFTYRVVDYGRTFGNPKGKRELHEKDPLLKVYPRARGLWF